MADSPPNVTLDVPVRFAPVMATGRPPEVVPVAGVRDETTRVGARAVGTT
jgi:hypothetical protein